MRYGKPPEVLKVPAAQLEERLLCEILLQKIMWQKDVKFLLHIITTIRDTD